MRTGHDPRLFSNPHSDEAYAVALVKALSLLNPSKTNLQLFFDIPDEIFKRRVLQALPEKSRAKYAQYLSKDANLMHRYQQQPFFTLEEKEKISYVDRSNSLESKCINVLSGVIKENPVENFPALVAISNPFIQKKVLKNCQEILVKVLMSNSDFKNVYKQAAENFDVDDKKYNIAAEDKKHGSEIEKNPFVEILHCVENLNPIMVLKHDVSFTENGDPENRYGIYQDAKDESIFVIKEKIIKCTKFTDFVPEVTLKDLYLLKVDSKNLTVKLFDVNDKNQALSLDKLKDILEPTTLANITKENPKTEESSPAPAHLSYGCHGY